MAQRLWYNDYDANRRKVYLQLFATGGSGAATAEAGGQPKLFTSAGGEVNTSATLVAINSALGMYSVTLTQAEISFIGLGRVYYDSVNTEPSDEEILVEVHPFLDDGTAQAGGASTITLRAGAPGANGLGDGATIQIIKGTGAGQARGVIAYDGTTKIATVDQNWLVNPDATSVYVVYVGPKPTPLGDVFSANLSSYQVAGTFGAALQPVRTGTAQAGGTSTLTLDAGASAVDNAYANQIIQIIAGTGAGQALICSSYVGATKVATMNGTWPVTPNNTSVFAIRPLGAIPGATAPTASQVAAAVVDQALAGHTGAGSVGAALSNVDAPVSSRSTFDVSTNQVIVGTNNDKTNYGLSASERTALVNAILNELLSGHATAGSVGEALMFARPDFTSADGVTLTWKKPDGTTLKTVTFTRASLQGVRTSAIS